MTPKYLWRVWSDQTHGTNSPTLFAPALKTPTREISQHGLTYDAEAGTLDTQLRRALYGNEAPSNPFIFTTSSFLYIIQHAIDKSKKKKEQNVHIICIDVDSARKPTGGNIHFQPVDRLMHHLKMPALERRYTVDKLDVSDVYVTTDSIVPGRGSFWVSFEVLKDEGLFSLYPEFGIIESQGNPGLPKPINDLRKYLFQSMQDCTQQEIQMAGHLCDKFVPIEKEEDDTLPTHLLSWVLALKGQDERGERLRSWLQDMGSEETEAEMEGGDIDENSIVEYNRYTQIYSVVRKWTIQRDSVVETQHRISQEIVAKKGEAYREWRKKRNSENNMKRKSKAEEAAEREREAKKMRTSDTDTDPLEEDGNHDRLSREAETDGAASEVLESTK